jgi:hypothetical protein
MRSGGGYYGNTLQAASWRGNMNTLLICWSTEPSGPHKEALHFSELDPYFPDTPKTKRSILQAVRIITGAVLYYHPLRTQQRHPMLYSW